MDFLTYSLLRGSRFGGSSRGGREVADPLAAEAVLAAEALEVSGKEG